MSALCFRLPELYNESRIEILCIADPVNIPLDMATPLGIVVTELVNNAYLHAFPHGGVGEISVKLRASSDQLVLSVSDNGIGFVETETRRRGIGLVRRLVGQVGGNSHPSVRQRHRVDGRSCPAEVTAALIHCLMHLAPNRQRPVCGKSPQPF